ncbi:MAG TPA: hypothetical protein VGD43_23950 [Micromonospora sp.]
MAHPATCVTPMNADPLAAQPLPRPGWNAPYRHCSDTRGDLLIGPLPDVPVRLLAIPTSWSYGAQWVGSSGGTGDQRSAAVVTARTGQVVDAPPIRLDRDGAISGYIQGPGGAWVNGCATAFPDHPDLPDISGVTACTSHTGTQHDGFFILHGLGPYEWPIRFYGTEFESGRRLAPEWSGDVGDRLRATPVPVQTSTLTIMETTTVLEPAARIDAFLTGAAPVSGDRVFAYHAVSGDRVGVHRMGGAPLDGLAPGPVVLQYVPAAGKPCWYVAPGAGPQPGREATPGMVTLTAGQVLESVSMVRGQTCLELSNPRLTRPIADVTLNGTGARPPLLR